MSVFVVGFDPGKTGGLVAVRLEDGGWGSCLRIPLIGAKKRQRVDGRHVGDFLHHVYNCSIDAAPILVIERVSSAPTDGVVGAFSFGKATGCVIGIAEAIGYSLTEVGPADWQRVMLRGHPRQPRAVRKRSCAQVASDLHPELSDLLRVKANWGLADAALIAEYHRRQLVRATPART